MPYLTMKRNLKLQLSPGLVTSLTSSQETEWVYSGTQNAHTYLFTYFPRTHTGQWTVGSMISARYILHKCQVYNCILINKNQTSMASTHILSVSTRFSLVW